MDATRNDLPRTSRRQTRCPRRPQVVAVVGSGEKARFVVRRPHSSGGGKAAGRIWAERDRGREDQSVSQVSHVLLGPHPLDDRNRRDPLGRGGALGRFRHHPLLAPVQRRRRILGRASGRQRHRRPEGPAGDQGSRQARWKLDHPGGAGIGAGRRHPPAAGGHRAGRRAAARRRRGVGRSIGADRRVVARHAQAGGRGVFRLDYSAGRNRRLGVRHRNAHLFRQDGAIGAGRRTPSAIFNRPF